jgi:transcriptional regulator with GAF, ATPase, and Fis domain
MVAGRHCEITLVNGRYVLVDVESQGETFVNGIPLKRKELEAGDELAVGNSLFLFHLEKGALGENEIELDEPAEQRTSAQELRYEELTYLRPEALAALPASERMARNLSVLLRISTGIGAIRDAELLAWTLLGMVFDVIPAERGAVLLTDQNGREVHAHVAWDRVKGPDQPVHVNQGILRRVVEGRVSVLEDETVDGPFAGVKILCAPLMAGERCLGILYLDTRNQETKFAANDLELLSAIAALAAMGLENARQFERLNEENQRLRTEANLTHDMVGRSARMRELYQFVERVAPSEATVLIGGESGTGKELAARAIHKNSSRRNQAFVALNCAALTETLLESELFGHEKGAFTNATSQKKGFLEVAEGGTIFLDEVGELPAILQAKLLRVLQEREFMRVGGTRTIKVNVRFLAATNRDLQKAVQDGTFRGDLFHRLNVIAIRLPALREHPEDVPLLAEHFVARYAEKCNRAVRGVSEPARSCLMRYEWPGNIRELENAMERAVVVGSSEWILPEDLPDAVLEAGTGSEVAPAKYHEAIRRLKKELILSALEQSGGNVTEAAKLLGVHGNYLHRLMSNLDLRAQAAQGKAGMKKQTRE